MGRPDEQPWETTGLASASRTTTQTGPASGENAKGVIVTLDMTNVAAAPSVTLRVQGYDLTSDKWYDILVSAAITTAITTVLQVCPGVTDVANSRSGMRLPRRWRWLVTANNANAGTYSVGVCIIP